MCLQRLHGPGEKYSQLWCLRLGPLTLHKKWSVKDRLRYPPLVPMWAAPPDLPTVGLLGRIWGSPRCGSLWEKMELHTRKLLLWNVSVLVHFQTVVSLTCCLEREGTQNGTNIFRPQSGGVEEEGLTT